MAVYHSFGLNLSVGGMPYRKCMILTKAKEGSCPLFSSDGDDGGDAASQEPALGSTYAARPAP